MWHQKWLLTPEEVFDPESAWSQFLENCAQLLRLVPDFRTAFSSEEVERQKHFLLFNFFIRKTVTKLGAGRNS